MRNDLKFVDNKLKSGFVSGIGMVVIGLGVLCVGNPSATGHKPAAELTVVHPLKASINQAGPTARCKLPAWSTDRFKVMPEVENHPEYNSEYTFAYQPRSVARK
jgi:hypothetical protein